VSTEIISPLAGKPAPKDILVDIDKLLAACADIRPDLSNRRNAWRPERPATGVSGRGSSTAAKTRWSLVSGSPLSALIRFDPRQKTLFCKVIQSEH
jgi:hypothetical protein